MSELHAIARLKIHHGKLEEFKRLAVKCMESVRTRDSGTLQYDWFFSDDLPRFRGSARAWRGSRRYDRRIASHLLDLGRDLRDAQPGVDEGARGVRRADLLSVPVDLMRRRNLGVSPRCRSLLVAPQSWSPNNHRAALSGSSCWSSAVIMSGRKRTAMWQFWQSPERQKGKVSAGPYC